MDDIANMVDQGVPPIVLMDPDSDKNANMHYVTVSGYNRDASGKITDLVIADSAGGNRYTMPAEEFQQKWDNLKMGGVSTGLNNVMISVVPNDGRKITGGDGVSRNASDIKLPKSSFLSNLKSSLARGIANAISNVTTAADKVWGGIKAAGNAIADGAKAVGNAVKKGWQSYGEGLVSPEPLSALQRSHDGVLVGEQEEEESLDHPHAADHSIPRWRRLAVKAPQPRKAGQHEAE